MSRMEEPIILNFNKLLHEYIRSVNKFIQYTPMCPLIFYLMFVHSIDIVNKGGKYKKKLC